MTAFLSARELILHEQGALLGGTNGLSFCRSSIFESVRCYRVVVEIEEVALDLIHVGLPFVFVERLPHVRLAT